ncbi:MAG: glycosyltransferase family 2 protein [Endomicrobiaceae bacterium]|nr:glycosyltransferase family 2 protein [Endomicrobiaceae bacterium]MDD3922744.1 glycosyltransferase family 2 protein [Endomicrobiaceae bacterium]
MKNKPFFSIIIPLYNKENYIIRTITSVLNQTFQDFEIIIINDGSTDNSLQIAKKIIDPRIKIFNQKNLGVNNARNAGIKKSKGLFIAFLDSDDAFTPTFLETIYNLTINHKNFSFFATAFKRVYKDNSRIDTKYGTKKVCIVKDFLTQIAKTGKFFIHISSVVVKRTVFDDVGYFFSRSPKHHSGITIVDDLDLWIRISWKYNLVYSNLIGCIYYTNTPVNVISGYGFKNLDCTFYENTIHKLMSEANTDKQKVNLQKLLYRLRNLSAIQFLIRGHFKEAIDIIEKQPENKEVLKIKNMIEIQKVTKQLSTKKNK